MSKQNNIDNIKVQEHFKLPDNFFNNFADNIDAKINKNCNPANNLPRETKNIISLKVILSTAAVMCILAVSAYFLQSSQKNVSSTSIGDQIVLSNEEYVKLMLEQIDPNVLEDVFAEAHYSNH